MASQPLFNALYDLSLADIFIETLSIRDLSVLNPLIAQVNNNSYDWLFSRIALKQYKICSTEVQKIRAPVIKIPQGFKKFHARIPHVETSYRFHGLGPSMVISGAMLYSYRTSWFIMWSETTQTIDECEITGHLALGLNVAVDPRIIINKAESLKSSAEHPIYIKVTDYQIDKQLTGFFHLSKLVAYTSKNRPHTTFLYLQSNDLADIHRAVECVNEKILVMGVITGIYNYIVTCFPGSDPVKIMPYIYCSNSKNPPEFLQIPIIYHDGDIWKRDVPLFRAFTFQEGDIPVKCEYKNQL